MYFYCRHFVSVIGEILYFSASSETERYVWYPVFADSAIINNFSAYLEIKYQHMT